MNVIVSIPDNLKKNGSPLHRAIGDNNLKLLEEIIKSDMDINVYDNWGCTPLHHACSIGKYEIAKLLIKEGANINLLDENGKSPLHLVCFNNNVEVAKLLIENGADVNILDADWYSPLYYAIKKSDYFIIKMLVENGADIIGFERNEIIIDIIKNIQGKHTSSIVKKYYDIKISDELVILDNILMMLKYTPDNQVVLKETEDEFNKLAEQSLSKRARIESIL